MHFASYFIFLISVTAVLVNGQTGSGMQSGGSRPGGHVDVEPMSNTIGQAIIYPAFRLALLARQYLGLHPRKVQLCES